MSPELKKLYQSCEKTHKSSCPERLDPRTISLLASPDAFNSKVTAQLFELQRSHLPLKQLRNDWSLFQAELYHRYIESLPPVDSSMP